MEKGRRNIISMIGMGVLAGAAIAPENVLSLNVGERVSRTLDPTSQNTPLISVTNKCSLGMDASRPPVLVGNFSPKLREYLLKNFCTDTEAIEIRTTKHPNILELRYIGSTVRGSFSHVPDIRAKIPRMLHLGYSLEEAVETIENRNRGPNKQKIIPTQAAETLAFPLPR